jgi:hypothetical protein
MFGELFDNGEEEFDTAAGAAAAATSAPGQANYYKTKPSHCAGGLDTPPARR